jgi:hypothetical protein
MRQAVSKFESVEQFALFCKHGCWRIVLSQYKTAKKLGVDVTELDHIEWLTNLFDEYLSSYRALLVGGLKHRLVFCARFGSLFSQSHFAELLSNLIKRHWPKSSHQPPTRSRCDTVL